MEVYIITQEIDGRVKVVGSGRRVYFDRDAAQRKFDRIDKWWNEHEGPKTNSIIKRPQLMRCTMNEAN